MKIQEYLRNGGDVIDLQKEPYNLTLKFHEDDGRTLFKYKMIESDLSLEICQEARGLILDRDNDWEVVSPGLRKFFNYGE